MKEIQLNKFKKGDFVPAEMLAKVLNCKPGSIKFTFGRLQLKQRIEHETKLSCKIEGDGLRILDDSESSNYNHRRFVTKLAGAKYRHKKMQQVNTSFLTTEEKEEHLRCLTTQSGLLQSIDNFIQKALPINLDEYNSALPKLFRKKNEDDDLEAEAVVTK